VRLAGTDLYLKGLLETNQSVQNDTATFIPTNNGHVGLGFLTINSAGAWRLLALDGRGLLGTVLYCTVLYCIQIYAGLNTAIRTKTSFDNAVFNSVRYAIQFVNTAPLCIVGSARFP
jgi:hypothetical protein